MSGGSWRVLLESGSAADGPTNMAVDAALLEAVRRGGRPVLRLYRWNPPALSFGRNQPAAGLYDEAAAAGRGITFVRRPTGGQAVLHADELTYAVVAPVAVIGKPREAYRRINQALVAGLRRLGVEAEVAGARVPHTGGGEVDWAAACFRDPAEGEVVVRGRKLVGSAQRCEGRVILQHGSVLVSGSQAPAEELLVDASRIAAPGDPGWTTLAELLEDRPDAGMLARAVVGGFEDVLGTALAPGALSNEESTRVKQLRVFYASRDWTWRR